MDNESDVLQCAAQLNRLILESGEYSGFIKAREKLREFPRYMEMADNFRRRQVIHEGKKLNGEYDGGEEMALANDYSDMCLISVLNDFFQAEMLLLSLIRDLNAKVFDGVEIDI